MIWCTPSSTPCPGMRRLRAPAWLPSPQVQCLLCDISANLSEPFPKVIFPAPAPSQFSFLDSSLFLCLLARESGFPLRLWVHSSLSNSPGTGYAYTLELDRRPQPDSASCSRMPLGRSLMGYQDSDVELLAGG